MLRDSADFNIIDFHNHYMPGRFEQAVVQAAPTKQRGRWEVIARRLSDEDLLLQGVR